VGGDHPRVYRARKVCASRSLARRQPDGRNSYLMRCGRARRSLWLQLTWYTGMRSCACQHFGATETERGTDCPQQRARAYKALLMGMSDSRGKGPDTSSPVRHLPSQGVATKRLQSFPRLLQSAGHRRRHVRAWRILPRKLSRRRALPLSCSIPVFTSRSMVTTPSA
jgi:hypothetical protein